MKNQSHMPCPIGIQSNRPASRPTHHRIVHLPRVLSVRVSRLLWSVDSLVTSLSISIILQQIEYSYSHIGSNMRSLHCGRSQFILYLHKSSRHAIYLRCFQNIVRLVQVAIFLPRTHIAIQMEKSQKLTYTHTQNSMKMDYSTICWSQRRPVWLSRDRTWHMGLTFHIPSLEMDAITEPSLSRNSKHTWRNIRGTSRYGTQTVAYFGDWSFDTKFWTIDGRKLA
jgi:hypothetical protein